MTNFEISIQGFITSSLYGTNCKVSKIVVADGYSSSEIVQITNKDRKLTINPSNPITVVRSATDYSYTGKRNTVLSLNKDLKWIKA